MLTTDLIVILHKLNDYSNIIRVILDGNDTHDICCILGIRVLAVLIGKDKARISFMDLSCHTYNPVNFLIQ